MVAAYSARVRPGSAVSFPVPWDASDSVAPADFTVRNATRVVTAGDPWAALMPAQSLGPGLVAEGHTIPIARVHAVHEGKRRARARRDAAR